MDILLAAIVAAVVASLVVSVVMLVTQRRRPPVAPPAAAERDGGPSRDARPELSAVQTESPSPAEASDLARSRRGGETPHGDPGGGPEIATTAVGAARPVRVADAQGEAAVDHRPVPARPSRSVAPAATGARASTVAGAPRPVSAATSVGVAQAATPDVAPAPSGTAAARAVAPRPVDASDGAGSATAARAAVKLIEPSALRQQIDAELRERRAEIARLEERLLAEEQSLRVRSEELSRKERSAEDRARNLEHSAARLKTAKQTQVRELERLAGLSASQARQILLRELEDELRHDSARLIRQVEEETKREADRRVRSILATCMQRVAGGHSAETTVSVVTLDSDDLKGRIIGREGRNIRALETLTGIDFIVDDTPGAVLLSGFDGMRREVARLTLEKLLADGRIHPARIEEAFNTSKEEIDRHVIEAGEQAALEANVGTLHPELVKLLGRLAYRTSYSQNVLAHSIECAKLASLIGDELGASARTARRAALLHDIGKAVSHEVEGPHALVGADLARRFGEEEAVVHGIEAHHNEVPMKTVEAVIVQVADSVSGARPGARGESLERYVSRLQDLERIAGRHAGVEKVYAMQAGREVRVIVRPEDVDDDVAALLSHKIARDVERELEYPGQIKVTVIRESRSVQFAK